VPTADPKTNGCPPDTDGDGIADDKDACPNEKGVPDPDPKKNGCPTVVRVSEKEILILEQVQFDTAKATIKKASAKLLDEVAGVLREHAEIARVEVGGHTDASGVKVQNQRLSQARAEAVVRALVERGIDKARLVGKGYGQEQPIATNDTKEGRGSSTSRAAPGSRRAIRSVSRSSPRAARSAGTTARSTSTASGRRCPACSSPRRGLTRRTRARTSPTR
jgi:outer membrane protein OmpA-like peptidoglycan-associated protein